MEKTTVYLNKGDYRRLKALAKEAGRPVAELVREAGLGVGRSGRGDLSERAEQQLDRMGEDR